MPPATTSTPFPLNVLLGWIRQVAVDDDDARARTKKGVRADRMVSRYKDVVGQRGIICVPRDPVQVVRVGHIHVLKQPGAFEILDREGAPSALDRSKRRRRRRLERVVIQQGVEVILDEKARVEIDRLGI